MELGKHSNSADMEKEGADALDNISKCISVSAAEESQPAAIVINGPEISPATADYFCVRS